MRAALLASAAACRHACICASLRAKINRRKRERRVKLNYWQATWPLDISECPCDLHFIHYMKDKKIAGKSIFHFGTGEHHLIALENAKLRRPNQIFGVTASKKEIDTYTDLIVGNARVANSYKAMFVDIYTLDARGLPVFDVVTLFHLGEFHDPKKQKYAPLDDRKLLDLMVRQTRPGGLVCFYRGSNGWRKSEPIVEDFVRRGRLEKGRDYKSLLICRRPRTS
jgi:SAM-dependent methyltransferase